MAKSLKVYQAQFGFYDSVVAAANQKAALRAWETHQNLFAEGQAHVATDEAAIAAALSSRTCRSNARSGRPIPSA
ncbi:hypothetical protein [Lichenihabitans psoromatis]|uniref:hypothetical protein n=1 Tax=Lichenihabitans psoromatis TaxID=2528642 RepID=UPI001035E414|nr:hypothetical protein [Lichenihabitans psoromatis]